MPDATPPVRKTPSRPDILSGIYFAFFIGIGVYSPFIYIYYRKAGLSDGEIKYLATIGPLVALACQPLWGMLADLFHARRLIVLLTALGGGLAALLYLTTTAFVPLLGVVALFYLFQNAPLPLVNSTAVLDHAQSELGFGRRRLWGSASFVIATLLAGQAIAAFGLQIIFPGYAAAMVLTAVFALYLPAAPAIRPAAGPGFWKGLGRFARIPELRWFFLGLILLGLTIEGNFVGFGLMWDERGGDPAGLGPAWALAAVLEVPLFFWGADQVRRRSPLALMVAAALLAALRWWLISAVANLKVLVLLQPLHTVMYVCYLWGAVHFIDRCSPGSIKNTGQSLLASGGGVALILGSFIAGHLFENYGTVVLYRAFTACALAAAVIFLIAGRIAARKREPDAAPD